MSDEPLFSALTCPHCGAAHVEVIPPDV